MSAQPAPSRLRASSSRCAVRRARAYSPLTAFVHRSSIRIVLCLTRRPRAFFPCPRGPRSARSLSRIQRAATVSRFCHATHVGLTAYRLSAHLAELTQNATYTETARLAADALKTLMLDPSTGLVFESGSLGSVVASGVTSDITVCNLRRTLRPYATGMYIEGLAVLASVDPDNSSEWNDLCVGCPAPRAQVAEKISHRMENAIMSATQNNSWFGGLPGALPGVLTFPFGTSSGVMSPPGPTVDDMSYSGSSSSLCHGRALTAPQAGSCRASSSRTIARAIPIYARTSARSSARRCALPSPAPRALTAARR
jgi:hypothetical protein